MKVWPIPISSRKTATSFVAIRHMNRLVVGLVEVFLARIGIEGRSKGLVVCRNLDEHTLDFDHHNPRPPHIRDRAHIQHNS